MTEPVTRPTLEGTTPGPWEIRWTYPAHRAGYPICKDTCAKGQSRRRVFSVSDEEIHEMEDGRWFEQVLGPTGQVIFGLGQDYDDVGDPPSEQDAALIAQAPALAAENQKLRAALEAFAAIGTEFVGRVDRGEVDSVYTYQLLKAALASAAPLLEAEGASK